MGSASAFLKGTAAPFEQQARTFSLSSGLCLIFDHLRRSVVSCFVLVFGGSCDTIERGAEHILWGLQWVELLASLLVAAYGA
jgi:hypothetical protein